MLTKVLNIEQEDRVIIAKDQYIAMEIIYIYFFFIWLIVDSCYYINNSYCRVNLISFAFICPSNWNYLKGYKKSICAKDRAIYV